VAAPFGSDEHRAYEKRLDDLHRSMLGESYPYLREHVLYGLPGLDEIDQLIRGLNAAKDRCFFTGDYMWQGRQFERGILAKCKRGWVRHLLNVYNRVTSLAIFRPIRLRERPDARANRFYLLIEKQSSRA